MEGSSDGVTAACSAALLLCCLPMIEIMNHDPRFRSRLEPALCGCNSFNEKLEIMLQSLIFTAGAPCYMFLDGGGGGGGGGSPCFDKKKVGEKTYQRRIKME